MDIYTERKWDTKGRDMDMKRDRDIWEVIWRVILNEIGIVIYKDTYIYIVQGIEKDIHGNIDMNQKEYRMVNRDMYG